jgi:hypothetical protein
MILDALETRTKLLGDFHFGVAVALHEVGVINIKKQDYTKVVIVKNTFYFLI